MASMALSIVACAVIMRICGRSLSGVVETSSRISSRPVISGIRLSIDQHVDAAFAEEALSLAGAGRLEHLMSLGPQGLAEHLPDFVFVVDEENRAAWHR